MNVSSLRLGKRSRKHDDRTLRLENYTQLLPPPPPRVNPAILNWGEMLNDSIGDCTIASYGHMVMNWSYRGQGAPIIIPDQQILEGYEDVTGEEGAAFDPGTGANDNGCAILDVLNWARDPGIGGAQIRAYTQLPLHRKNIWKQAIDLFGGINIGVQLPISAQDQVGSCWHVTDPTLSGDNAPGSWGGHSIPIVGYNKTGVWAVTWGELQRIGWGWLWAYCDEAYACISPLWFSDNGLAESGFDLPQLEQDLRIVTQ